MLREIPPRDDFPDAFHEAFARVFVEFGRIEYLTALCVKDLLQGGFNIGMEEALRIGNFSKMCEKAEELGCDKLESNELMRLKQFLDEGLRLADERNHCVHAYWTLEKDSVLRIRPRWDKKAKTVDWSHSRPVTIEELLQLASDMRALWDGFDPVRLQFSVRS
jgi:hypothetical protein